MISRQTARARETTHLNAAGIDLYWLPLGAGGHFVRFNGRVYETIRASIEHREPLALYHSALVITVPEGRYVIENAWPIPNQDGSSRGVVVEGPVGTRLFAHLRTFRYEIRRWRDGVIADVGEAVESPTHLTDDEDCARHLLLLVPAVPSYLWGRDELGIGDMWNSNSVISWLLERSGLAAEEVHPPTGGRAPGWVSGITYARLSEGLARTRGRPT